MVLHEPVEHLTNDQSRTFISVGFGLSSVAGSVFATDSGCIFLYWAKAHHSQFLQPMPKLSKAL